MHNRPPRNLADLRGDHPPPVAARPRTGDADRRAAPETGRTGGAGYPFEPAARPAHHHLDTHHPMGTRL